MKSFWQKHRISTKFRCGIGLCLISVTPVLGYKAQDQLVNWQPLPLIPGEGAGEGMFAGVAGGSLVAVGGRLLSGSNERRVSRQTWSLDSAVGEWARMELDLPEGRAYGAASEYLGGLLIVGGSDENAGARDQLWWLRPENVGWSIEDLGRLPRAVERMGFIRIGDRLYLAGGKDEMGRAVRRFGYLDLSARAARPVWVELPAWPGAARHSPVMGWQSGALYIMGGYGPAEKDDPYGGSLVPLRDAFRFRPASGEWEPVSGAPAALAGAPSPAYALGQSHLAVLGRGGGGISEASAAELWIYHTITDTWIRRGRLPAWAEWTDAPVIEWSGGVAVVGGGSGRAPTLVREARREAIFGWVNWTVLFAYMGCMLGMGWFFSLRGKTTNDFFLAGQRIPWWAAGLSIFGTQLSALSYMGIPAAGYMTDWVRVLKTVGTVLVIPLIIWFYVPILRRLSVVTAYEYLERRFHVSMRLFGGVVFIASQLARIGALVYLPSVALAAVTGMNIYWCVAIMGAFCTIYTVMGGVEAVIWTDVVQVAVLLLGAFLCIGIVAWEVGGFGTILNIGIEHGKFHTFDWRWDPTAMVVWVMVIGPAFNHFAGFTTDQTVVQRYLTTRDIRAASRGLWMNAIIAVPAGMLFYGMGTCLFAFYRTFPDALSPGRNDEIVPWFVVQQLPAGVAAIVIAGIFAAVMSSLDSSMNSIATTCVNDFYRRFVKGVSDRSSLLVARAICVVVGVIGSLAGAALVTMDLPLIIDQLWLLLGLMGGGLAGVFVLGLFSRRATTAAAWLAATAGFFAPLWAYFRSDLHFFLYPVIGIGTALVIGFLGSCILPAERRLLEGLTIHSIRK